MKKQSPYLDSAVKQNLNDATWQWLEEKAARVYREKNASALYEAFTVMPRKTGWEVIGLPDAAEDLQKRSVNVLQIEGWTTDRLCRVWLIMQMDVSDKAAYLTKINNLFSGASMNELVALYSVLPALEYPGEWKMRCAEGIRSNIGSVLDAILYENSYPFQCLDEAAFNQMVLKAFFADKDVDRIIGLDQRANPELASVLFDYAHERWSAGRSVNPQLWRLTGKYIHAGNFSDIQRLWNSGSRIEKIAALLACSQSNYELARLLWENDGSLKKEIVEKKINWHNLDQQPDYQKQ